MVSFTVQRKPGQVTLKTKRTPPRSCDQQMHVCEEVNKGMAQQIPHVKAKGKMALPHQSCSRTKHPPHPPPTAATPPCLSPLAQRTQPVTNYSGPFISLPSGNLLCQLDLDHEACDPDLNPEACDPEITSEHSATTRVPEPLPQLVDAGGATELAYKADCRAGAVLAQTWQVESTDVVVEEEVVLQRGLR